jgi:hypothetical protein
MEFVEGAVVWGGVELLDVPRVVVVEKVVDGEAGAELDAVAAEG